MLRVHTLDVCDLSWSPSSQQVVTACVDNTAAVRQQNCCPLQTQLRVFFVPSAEIPGASWAQLQLFRRFITSLPKKRSPRTSAATTTSSSASRGTPPTSTFSPSAATEHAACTPPRPASPSPYAVSCLLSDQSPSKLDSLGRPKKCFLVADGRAMHAQLTSRGAWSFLSKALARPCCSW
jgi:hypothetical protein